MFIQFHNIIGGYKIHFLIELNLINVHSHVRAKQWVEKHSEAAFGNSFKHKPLVEVKLLFWKKSGV